MNGLKVTTNFDAPHPSVETNVTPPDSNDTPSDTLRSTPPTTAGSAHNEFYQPPQHVRLAQDLSPPSTSSSDTTDRPYPASNLNAANFYSGRNPVPRIESYWELYPGRVTPPDSPIPRPEDLNAREKQHRKRIEKHTKVVKDPITGKRIKICDAKYAPPVEASKHSKEIYPPEQWTLFLDQLRGTTVRYLAFVAGTFIVLNGVFRLPYSISILIIFASGVSWWRNIDSAWDAFLHYVESDHGKQRMRIPGVPGNESVEWLNGIIAKLWPQINPDLFTSMVDLIEDVMQASIPSIITQVKIVNMGQGVVPMRLLSMRWLDEENEGSKDSKDTKHGATDRLNEEEQIGEWASLEVSFGYRAQPSSSSAQSKAKNANLLIHFFMGLNGFIGTPIPVWVELRGVTGTCRMKVQLIPDPPFVKLVTFTLLGMPKIEIAAVPMNQRFFNVMNLPVLSDFVYSSVKAAAKQFVAPSNYTLDLSKILVGDDTKHELLAIGVLVVNIKSALEVMASDIDGKSDCYVTLSYSKCRKPLWSTRIIFSDLNPVWDETAVLLLSTNEVKAAEKLVLSMYDSDRWTADDVLGKTEMDVSQLIRNPGKLWEREDNLKGVKEGMEMPGTVKWNVVYYGNRSLNPTLITKGEDPNLPENLQHLDPEVRGRPQSRDSTVSNTPPDPDYPSGILSLQIHNIVGLERHIISGSKSHSGIRRGEAQTTEEEEEGQNLPSGYCSIVLDYQKIYLTRTKPMTSKPFFNCGTERFVRDWTKAKVMVVVRDSRLREEDPILGVVTLELKDVFTTASKVSRFYPIMGGIGYGKIRLSLLFRSIDAQIPRPLIAADVASVEIVTRLISAEGITDPEVSASDTIKFSTPLISKKALRAPDGGWAPVHNTHGSTGFRLGMRHRHSSACIMTFSKRTLGRNKTVGAAIFWLKDFPDTEEVTVQLPVYLPDSSSSLERFKMNYGVECGKRGGTVTLVIKVHRGLGHSHRRAAKKDKEFKDVIAAVSCVEHIRGEGSPVGTPSMEDPNTSSSSDDESNLGSGRRRRSESGLGDLRRRLTKGREDRKEERKEMHRMERGVMQWKGARTLAWMGSGLRDKGREVKGVLRMEPRKSGVETEA